MWHPCPVQAEPRELWREDDTEEVGVGGAGPHDNDHVAEELGQLPGHDGHLGLGARGKQLVEQGHLVPLQKRTSQVLASEYLEAALRERRHGVQHHFRRTKTKTEKKQEKKGGGGGLIFGLRRKKRDQMGGIYRTYICG